MKNIIKSLVVVVAVAAVASVATYAVFSDTETSAGNTFTAGTLDLTLGEGTPLPFSISNVAPGDSDEGKVTLTNDGSLDGDLDIKLSNLVENENGCVEPEVEAHDPNCSATGGDLGLVSLEIATFVDVNGNGVWDSGDIKLAYGGQVIPYSSQSYESYATPRNTLTGWDDIVTLAAGDSVDVIMKWRVRTDWNYPNYNQNIIQSDSLAFDALTSLEQVGQNGGVTN